MKINESSKNISNYIKNNNKIGEGLDSLFSSILFSSLNEKFEEGRKSLFSCFFSDKSFLEISCINLILAENYRARVGYSFLGSKNKIDFWKNKNIIFCDLEDRKEKYIFKDNF